MAKSDDREQMMTTADVASRFAVSVSTVERWRFEGRGPQAVRLPTGSVRYRRSDVLAWERTSTPA